MSESIFVGLNVLDFTERFSTDDSCRLYLSEIKWGNGYKCGNCSHTKHYSGKKVGDRICAKCKYRESATARTVFHKVKFSLRKAFHIVYMMTCNKKGASSYEISRQLTLRQKTCWLFQRKIREAMQSGGNSLLEGTVEVDEFFVGGPEEGKKGRGAEDKKLVVLAIQVDGFGIHQSYAKVIDNAGSDELGAFLDATVEPDAIVKTDNWKGYVPCKKNFPNLEQHNSGKGKRFPLMHRQIMMFKGWLRGIHHHCKLLQTYLNEYCFKFNRLKYPEKMFHNLVVDMVGRPPVNFFKKQS